MDESLYRRLGGYDAIVAFTTDLLRRLRADDKLGRFWAHRGADGIAREHQLLIDYLVHVTGGHMVYTGRDMRLSHAGMGIDAEDWRRFIAHVTSTAGALGVGAREGGEVLAFLDSIKADIMA
ncbi:MAG: group 1 truncated hemoglobin [Myxococcales bacterium]|nr:group 1 truncated hemoglobin [Myxococcales bacterium]